jgi:biotin synthase
MLPQIADIISKDNLTKEDILALLSLKGKDLLRLYEHALKIKTEYVGRKVYFRGLIEFSNRCTKNCFYCGIRCGNQRYKRYQLTPEEVTGAALYAWKNRFASIVIQSGERSDKRFTQDIENILSEITRLTNGELHITLSLGEQTKSTYRRWREAGAHRYLLRIETSNPELYKKIHPDDARHSFTKRIGSLRLLRQTGYQVGTGVMIGLPFQTLEDLADDLIFFRDFDVDMVGMGPYIEHEDTPLYPYRNLSPPLPERLGLSLKMVAILRIMMKDINIAATTAMQTIDPNGREKALRAGANVMMPNLTPVRYKQSYLLYKDKPGLEDDAEESKEVMEENIRLAGDTIGYGEWGDSKRYTERRR